MESPHLFLSHPTVALASQSVWSGASDSSHLLLLHPTATLASYITVVLTFTPQQPPLILGTSGPSCYLAERLSQSESGPEKKIAGLILQSPLASVYRVAFDFRFTLNVWGYGDMFPNIDRVSNVQCPVLVIHGTR